MPSANTTINVNNRDYTWPKQPIVIVCIDGSEPDYIIEAVKAGKMPWMEGVINENRVRFTGRLRCAEFHKPE